MKDDIQTEEAIEASAGPGNDPVEIVGISFRRAGKIYYFSPDGHILKAGDKVIVETSRGVEIGTVKITNKIVGADKIISPLRKILRPADEKDMEHDAKNKELELDAALVCKKKIAELKLEMNLVSVEYTFDNSKLIFYFTSETRVDFRELVKYLASQFRTRIELRQIGIRDEAKYMGGLGNCGRCFCCTGFLTDFVQVSIKMAKEQNFSLNSAKISGACGRLMCCLGYERETYEDAYKNAPPIGSEVATVDGPGTVTEIKPLSGSAKVKLFDKQETVKLFPFSELKVTRLPKGKKTAEKNDEDAAECEF